MVLLTIEAVSLIGFIFTWRTQGYQDIWDSVQCVEQAIAKLAKAGEYRVINQFMEQFSMDDHAMLFMDAGKKLRLCTTHIGAEPREGSMTTFSANLAYLDLQLDFAINFQGRSDTVSWKKIGVMLWKVLVQSSLLK